MVMDGTGEIGPVEKSDHTIWQTRVAMAESAHRISPVYGDESYE